MLIKMNTLEKPKELLQNYLHKQVEQCLNKQNSCFKFVYWHIINFKETYSCVAFEIRNAFNVWDFSFTRNTVEIL